MKPALIAAAIALVVGFGVAWSWQGSRWDTDVASIKASHAESLAEAHRERDERIAKAEDQKEEVQNEFDAFKAAEAERNAAIAGGTQRVYVRAKCPAVPAAATDSGRTESGAAELDPAYRQALSDLRRGAAEQLRLLNICRAELMAR